MQQITALTLTLKSPTSAELPPFQAASLGPFMQGVLMERANRSYAELLHQLPFNPYSQYVCKDRDGALLWKINALNAEAAEHVIEPVRKMNSFEVRSRKETFEVVKTTTETINLKSLLDSIYEPGESKAKIQFITPTSFKSQGAYVFMPTARLMLQNLLMHYGQVYDQNKEADEETVSFIDQHVRIVSYDLQSRYFAHVSGGDKKIPAFAGNLTLSMNGPTTVVGLVRMLLKFGEYAGVGIKTSMGMGGIKCLKL